ncbi:hypothetical protein EHW64_13680 [Erwinia psidii]|uniref:hypothetical protein n=1 Tax=Erwinia psidii TaxID=69224 RepID=UPI00226B7F25|nr:hypothetical protein [Erwinia psidii]MCX8962153.1 hypothetical protein [Erwinia psidii]
MKLCDLITNPGSGRLSTSDTIVLGSFLVTSFVLIWSTFRNGEVSEGLYAAYIGGWVVQSQFSKYQALQRDKEWPRGPDRNSE